jgi:hypothetical protein
MPELSKDLRNDLGRAIVKARQAAEGGARNALESLAVERHEPHGSMSPDERKLRNRLRARGRQLGDVRDKQRGSQSIDRLAHEVAYEHWHRMLFARFLAENDLLIHPEHGVAVSLDEIDELAREAGEDPHTMAARFAQDSLPQIFRTGDPVLEVTLAPETRQALDKLLDGLPSVVFTADDSLGWTYQYWQTEKKDAVNESGNKIGADELPAVTQLFTEHYMVLFLYHNTIGAWHAGKVLAANPSLAETAQSEEELRQAVCLQSQGGYDFEYLRFVREAKEGDEEDTPTGPWRPAAGTFEGWPKTAKELKVLDPCCGSGHFLTEGFELLVRLRMDEEGVGLEDAIRGVLADNLHGLELDPRCTQIAAFNLAMAAWKLAGKPIELPAMHIACSGLAVGSTKAEWTELAGKEERLRAGMERLYDLFEQAPELGSLIDPKALGGDLYTAEFAELQPLLEQALARESGDVEETERAVAAQGMARAAKLLSGDYTLAISNVPYLGRGQQSDVLKDFADEHYKQAKADLATIFVERMLRWLGATGTVAAVTPQNWLFLGRYKKLREKLLRRRTWNLVARLGPKGFQTPMWDFNVMLLTLSACNARGDHMFCGLDVAEARNAQDKAALLKASSASGFDHVEGNVAIRLLRQGEQVANPDARIAIEASSNLPLLSEYADAYQGIGTSDNAQFLLRVWEFDCISREFRFVQAAPSGALEVSGASLVLPWERGEGRYFVHAMSLKAEGRLGGWKSGGAAWGKPGFAISVTGKVSVSVYLGDMFDTTAGVLIPKNNQHSGAIDALIRSSDYEAMLRRIDQALSITEHTLLKVPFDLDHWQKVAAEKYPNGLPEPQSDDPTQWLFHGHPAKAEPATVLQVAIGRLLGYQWPPELDTEMRLADEAREWVSRCDALKDFTDEDGIVCLSATRGERSAADRLRELLAAAFGSDWSAAKERELLAFAGDGKKSASSLDIWLRDKFFEEHCKLFHHRPFVWHIWDGNKDGFHCLVNAHKLTGPDGEGRRTLQAITHSYLRDWIDRQKADQADDKEGADARLAAAQDLEGQLEKILEGEPPYDLFVRWKPLHEQAIGWEPDINDGVRLNARPFMNAELRTGGKKGAGVLRWKPNIKWKKDRGKEPQSLRPKTDFPWFWGCNGDGMKDERIDYDEAGARGREFDGNRWNDLHYSRAVKETAREILADREAEKASQ